MLLGITEFNFTLKVSQLGGPTREKLQNLLISRLEGLPSSSSASYCLCQSNFHLFYSIIVVTLHKASSLEFARGSSRDMDNNTIKLFRSLLSAKTWPRK